MQSNEKLVKVVDSISEKYRDAAIIRGDMKKNNWK